MSILEFGQRRVLWTFGRLRCVLITRQIPPPYAVEIREDDRILVREWCEDVEDAEQIADTLWTMFIESAT